MHLPRLLASITTAIAALTAIPAFAWGSDGHQVVATIAYAQLNPSAKSEVDRLLASDPGETMASISTWADEHRNPATAPWHYVNFPRESCAYDPERDCAGGRCVVAAIEQQMTVLGSKAPDDKRLSALKYLVHFEADVH